MSILYFYKLLPFFFLEFFYPILRKAIGSKKGKIEEKVISLAFEIKNLAWNFFPNAYYHRICQTVLNDTNCENSATLVPFDFDSTQYFHKPCT